MKYFSIDTRIDQDLFNKFIEFANTNSEDEWTISIWTLGGMGYFAEMITKAINFHHLKSTVHLVCLSSQSAGFTIFYKANCKKFLSSSAIGHFHLAAADMRLNSKKEMIDAEHVCIAQNWKDSNHEEDFAKNFMNDKELKKYKK